MSNDKDVQKVRRLILFFMVMLALSGVTAFPIEIELHFLLTQLPLMPARLKEWITIVYDAVKSTNVHYPFCNMVMIGSRLHIL